MTASCASESSAFRTGPRLTPILSGPDPGPWSLLSSAERALARLPLNAPARRHELNATSLTELNCTHVAAVVFGTSISPHHPVGGTSPDPTTTTHIDSIHSTRSPSSARRPPWRPHGRGYRGGVCWGKTCSA